MNQSSITFVYICQKSQTRASYGMQLLTHTGSISNSDNHQSLKDECFHLCQSICQWRTTVNDDIASKQKQGRCHNELVFFWGGGGIFI